METKKFIYYNDSDMRIGWFEEYPDYRTQGETFEDLKENLSDIYADLSSDAIPYIRRVGELRVAGNGEEQHGGLWTVVDAC